MKGKIIIGILLVVLTLVLTGCELSKITNANQTNNNLVSKLLDKNEIFTDRDLKQSVDVNSATTYNVKDDNNITISKEGTYVITGSAKDASVVVAASSDAKVQLVLNNLTLENESIPCIYVKSADKVFINLIGDNNLLVTGSFEGDDAINLDAVIFSKEDLVINGNGTLNISSTDNGITSKDDLKITGGSINITCKSDALEANDSIAIYDGNITINSKKDGLHAEYKDDTSVGYVYISGGILNITASDDAIHATTIVQIDGGTITTNAREGLEGTYVQINDGTLNIIATDDGINAGNMSSKYSATIEINGGTITIDMGQGDTDAVDSNGDLIVSGGSININAASSFDYDGNVNYTGGTIIVNGEEINEITNQMMGGQGNMRR